MSIEQNGGAARRVPSAAAMEHAVHHKDEVVPSNLFRQFKNLEAQIEEAQEELDQIIEQGISPERQQDPATRESDINEGREATKQLEALKEEQRVLEETINARKNGSK